MIKKEGRELSALENEVVKAIHTNHLLSENIEPEIQAELTTGQRLAHQIATFGGSWTFIILFFSFF
ncbi:MAG: hypothetical protein K9I85_06325 [Saprospiraceae bacterium]|nr:hypothetical protein [Saprospiraceae bacterium]